MKFRAGVTSDKMYCNFWTIRKPLTFWQQLPLVLYPLFNWGPSPNQVPHCPVLLQVPGLNVYTYMYPCTHNLTHRVCGVLRLLFYHSPQGPEHKNMHLYGRTCRKLENLLDVNMERFVLPYSIRFDKIYQLKVGRYFGNVPNKQTK